ncbi:hypothetical protein Vretifemale_20795 [Volvox reticuliferus]|nr:hypothetical protein Vretifemale_20795 [Volvox reticuliferus]
MLSGAPSRSCPAAIPHGGILVPISSGSPIANPQLGGPLRPCRSRPASELALQFTCGHASQQPHRRHQPRGHPGVVLGLERQPGPQEDGCGCQGAPGIQHHTQPSQNTTPQQPFADPLSSTPSQSAAAAALTPQTDSSSAPSSPSSASTSFPLPRVSGAPGLTNGVRGSETGPHPISDINDCPAAAHPGEQQAGSSINSNIGSSSTQSNAKNGGSSSSGSTMTSAWAEDAPLAAGPGGTPLRLDPTSLPGRIEFRGGTSGSGDVQSDEQNDGQSGHLAADSLRPHPLASFGGPHPHDLHNPQRSPRTPPSPSPSHHQPHQQQQRQGQEQKQEASNGSSSGSTGECSEQQLPRFRSSSSPSSENRQPEDGPGGVGGAAPGSVPRESLGSGETSPGAGSVPGASLGLPPLPGAPGGLGGGSQLPPLRLDFLNWSQLQGELGTGSSSSSTGRSPQGPRGGSGGAARRRRGGAAASAEGRTRGDRILQLVLAAKTLLQLRAVISRHLNDMSASTASVALSRLAGLSMATMRLRRAQQQQPIQQPEPQLGPPPQPQEMLATTRRTEARKQQQIQELGNLQGGGDEDEQTKEIAAKQAEMPTTSATSVSRITAPAAASGRAAAAGGGTANADVDADASADPSARVQQGSLRLMRLLLRHIALCVDTGAGYSSSGGGGTAAAAGPAGARNRGGGNGPAAPASSSPSASSSPAPSSARPPSASRGPQRARTLPASSSPPYSWRLPAPDHRARLAGNVLATLARVGLKPGPSDLWALYRLVEEARPDLFLASPQQLSRLASSLPLLGPLRPSPPWMDHFASVSRSKMYAAEPGQLAAFVWCLARLGHNPGELWLHSLTHHLNRDGNLPSATPGQLCQILWALHRLEFSPDPDWRADCTAAVQVALTTAIANPAVMSRRPPWQSAAAAGRQGNRRYDRVDARDSEEDDLYDSSSSVDEFEPDLEAEVGPRAPAGGAGGGTATMMAGTRRYGSVYADLASLLLWAVRMDMAPGPAGMQMCLDRLMPALRSMRRVHLLRLILALAEADHRPSEAFMARLLACLQPKLPLLGPTQLTQLLVAVSRLRFVPPQSWLVAFLQASRPHLRHYNPALVTATYQVFAGWQLRPSRAYLQSLHSLLDSLMPEFTPQGLATVLQSMSTLGIKPQHRWLARALEVLTEAAARNAAGAVPPTHGSVSGIDAAVGPIIAASALSAPSVPLKLTLTARSPGGHFTGGPVSFVPPTSAIAGAAGVSNQNVPRQQQQTLRQQQRSAAAAALVTAVCSLRGVVQFDGERPPRSGTATAAAVGMARAASMAETARVMEEDAVREAAVNGSASTGTGDAEVATAADCSDILLPYELWSSAKQLTDLCGELFDAMSGPELAKLLTALSWINFYPGRNFLAAHARATARAGAQLAPTDKEALATCYSRLAALAPRMAEEARRQAEARQARSAVIVADPWVD